MKKRLSYKVEFRKTPNWFITLFLGTVFISFLIALVVITNLILLTDNSNPDHALFLMLIVILEIWILDLLLWQLNGRETLQISNKIEILKHGKIFKSVKIIEFNEFELVYSEEDNTNSFLAKLYGLKGGKIVINYLGRDTRFGQDITLDLADIVVNEIEYAIERIKLKV